jgi:hypothetical protein
MSRLSLQDAKTVVLTCLHKGYHHTAMALAHCKISRIMTTSILPQAALRGPGDHLVTTTLHLTWLHNSKLSGMALWRWIICTIETKNLCRAKKKSLFLTKWTLCEEYNTHKELQCYIIYYAA